MNKPTNKPWNEISFWRSVKKSYKSSYFTFLCICSRLFNSVYNEYANRRSLNTLANKFLKETGQKHLVHPWKSRGSNGTVLFSCKKDEDNCPIREQFINWNIKRLTKQKQ